MGGGGVTLAVENYVFKDWTETPSVYINIRNSYDVSFKLGMVI